MSENLGEVFVASKGKVIQSVYFDKENNRLVFDFGEYKMVMRDDGQSCCEDRYMVCDDNLSAFAGATLLDGEVAGASSVPCEDEVHEVQFLRITTDRGVIVVSNHNEHNGYYGGIDIICEKATP